MSNINQVSEQRDLYAALANRYSEALEDLVKVVGAQHGLVSHEATLCECGRLACPVIAALDKARTSLMSSQGPPET